jgi:hypothetical protein
MFLKGRNMVYLKGLLGGLAGAIVAYIVYAAWIMYVLPQIHAVAGGLGTLFWLLMITGFGLGFYLAVRGT